MAFCAVAIVESNWLGYPKILEKNMMLIKYCNKLVSNFKAYDLRNNGNLTFSKIYCNCLDEHLWKKFNHPETQKSGIIRLEFAFCIDSAKHYRIVKQWIFCSWFFVIFNQLPSNWLFTLLE